MTSTRERLNENDEIDLVELVKTLWRKKLLITVTTIFVTAVAGAYAFLATPVYEARVFVLPPSQNDIAHLNYGRGGESGLDRLSVKDIADVYARHLQSESLRRAFFQTVFLPTVGLEERNGSQDALYGRFNRLLGVAQVGKDAPARFSVTAKLPDPQQAVQWVTDYVQMAGNLAKSEVLKNVESEAMVKANNLQQRIYGAQDSARKQREDQIVQLKEALLVARSIGLEKPPIISYGTNRASEFAADTEGPLTYMRGSKALEAEIENLQNRQSDDPFIKNMREQQAALSFYRSLKIDPVMVAVYRQDGIVEVPDRPVQPKKLIILVLGAVGGLVLGLLLAAFSHVWSKATVVRDPQ